MATPEVDFSGWIKEALELYQKNFAVLVVASLIAVVLGTVTLGILAGPLLVGLNLIALRLIDQDGTVPEIADVFKGFKFFLPSFLLVLVWTLIIIVAVAILGAVPCLGNILGTIIPFVVYAGLVFAPFLIHEKRVDFWNASMMSFKKIGENPGPLFGLGLIAVLLASVGGVVCGIGVALTLPMYSLIIGIAYRRVFDLQPPAATVADTPDVSPAAAPEATVSEEPAPGADVEPSSASESQQEPPATGTQNEEPGDRADDADEDKAS